MLENISDYLSLIVLVISAVSGLYILFSIQDRRHHEEMKKRQESYYSFYENMNDEFDDTGDEPYFE